MVRKKLISSIQLIKNILLNHKVSAFLILLILILSIANSLHASYPDEFDNILGGYFITQGKLPYIAYFTHHGPFAYFYAAWIAIFSGPSFVNFRIILAISNFLLGFLFVYYIYKRFGQKYSWIILIIWSAVTLSATYWWAQMLLADSLVALLFLGVITNLVFIYLSNQKFNYRDYWFNSALLSLVILTSLTYLYVVVIVYCSMGYWIFRNRRNSGLSWLKIGWIFLLPYLIFLMYLLLTRSYSDYYYQSIYYNKEYYVRLSDGSQLNNPIRHLIIIFAEFVDRYRALLISIKDLNLGYPLNSFLALGNIAVIVYLIVIKRYKLTLFMFLVLVYLTTRTDPFQSKETDYQSLPYDYFSLFNAVMSVYFLSGLLKKQIGLPLRLIGSALYILIILFSFYSGLFLFNKSFEKFYAKYMGIQPLIYDRPAIANNLNKVLSKDDYYYIGPFDFEEHLYMKSHPASKYMIALPGMDHSDKIKSEVIKDLEKNKPKIIVFNTNDRIYSQETGKFIIEYLNREYFTLDSLNYPEKTITINQNSLGNQTKYELARHFFFDKNKKDALLITLFNEGWISKVN